MSASRLLGEGRSFYHCVSRVVDRRFVFGDEEKAVFRKTLRLLERFSGVRVVTYCLMSNHFHLLLDVPGRAELRPLSLKELIAFLPELHDATVAEGVLQEIERALESERAAASNEAWRSEREAPLGGRTGGFETGGDAGGANMAKTAEAPAGEDLAPGSGEVSGSEAARNEGLSAEEAVFWEGLSAGSGAGVAGILARYERRRGDLSVFMKMLKQRVSIYMNKRLDRVGTLWEARYKSVLVEGNEAALMAVAAYIDLNPVRAGIAELPEDYPFSGYGEAVTGGRRAGLAKRGLGRILREAVGRRGQDAGTTGEDWHRTMARYRLFLYETGVARPADPATGGGGGRAGVSPEAVEALRAQASLGAPGGPTEQRSPALVGTRGGGAGPREGTEPHAGCAGEPVPEDLAALAAALRGLLRGKVRYFCDGGAFGSAAFVEEALARGQDQGLVDPDRRAGAKHLRGAKWGPLRVLRGLQKAVFG